VTGDRITRGEDGLHHCGKEPGSEQHSRPAPVTPSPARGPQAEIAQALLAEETPQHAKQPDGRRGLTPGDTSSTPTIARRRLRWASGGPAALTRALAVQTVVAGRCWRSRRKV
jgi:hypothetical protein